MIITLNKKMEVLQVREDPEDQASSSEDVIDGLAKLLAQEYVKQKESPTPGSKKEDSKKLSFVTL